MKIRIWIALVVCDRSVAGALQSGGRRLESDGGAMAKARADGLAHPGRVVTAHDPREAPDFGTASTSVLNIGAYAFQGASNTGDQFADDGNGYRYLIASTSGGYMAAPVQLPAGVMIDELGISSAPARRRPDARSLRRPAFGKPITIIGLTTSARTRCFVTAPAQEDLYFRE